MNTYIERDGKKIAVKNLGWLIRHWRTISLVELTFDPTQLWEVSMAAHLQDGTSYHTNWMSLDICWSWLDRPIFRDLKADVRVGGLDRTAKFTIGNSGWRAVATVLHGPLDNRQKACQFSGIIRYLVASQN